MKRSKLREEIFKLLFRVEFVPEAELAEQQILFFEQSEEKISQPEQKYIEEKFADIVQKLPEIDELINTRTTGWKTKRMNKVDLTILRLAVYEMKWDDEIPPKVAMNEAVELAKKFSGEEGFSFVNGVLANLFE